MPDKNPTTRRHPRTLAEAFGPETAPVIFEEPEPRTPLVYKILGVVYVVAIATLILVM